MNRKEIISSKEYWLSMFEIKLSDIVEKYRQNNGYKDFDEMAIALDINLNTIRQLCYDSIEKIRIEELVELSLKIGYAPKIEYVKLTDIK